MEFDDILLQHCNAVHNQNTIDRWMKGCILPFPKKVDLGLAKNYWGITLTSIAAKTYNTLLRNRIEPLLKTYLERAKMAFGEIDPRRHSFDYASNSWRCTSKKHWNNHISYRLYQALWLHTQRKDGANTARQRPTQSNHRSHNDAI